MIKNKVYVKIFKLWPMHTERKVRLRWILDRSVHTDSGSVTVLNVHVHSLLTFIVLPIFITILHKHANSLASVIILHLIFTDENIML